jgi:hypothetical protein
MANAPHCHKAVPKHQTSSVSHAYLVTSFKTASVTNNTLTATFTILCPVSANNALHHTSCLTVSVTSYLTIAYKLTPNASVSHAPMASNFREVSVTGLSKTVSRTVVECVFSVDKGIMLVLGRVSYYH